MFHPQHTASFGELMNDFFYLTELSENSLDVHIPSFPGSPRTVDFASSIEINYNEENDTKNDTDKRLSQAVDNLQFLQEDNSFLEAAEMGDSQAIEEFLGDNKTNIQQLDHLGRNALHLAICSEDEPTILLLLKAGVNPNVKDKVGMTPLLLCLLRCPSVRFVNMLFDYGAKFLARTGVMDTGLFMQFTMMCGPNEEDEKILHLLANKSCTIDDQLAPGGRQPLHFAAMSNNCKLVKILLELGADLYATDARGNTPKDVALTFKCKEAIQLLAKMEELYTPFISSNENSSIISTTSNATLKGDSEVIGNSADTLIVTAANEGRATTDPKNVTALYLLS